MVAANNIFSGTIFGVAKNMPIMAVNTISMVTRGLHNARKLPKLDLAVCIVISETVLIETLGLITLT